jgi:hypothetical protein
MGLFQKNMTEFALASFCYGERYIKQVNRLIESFKDTINVPEIFIVTDNPEGVIKEEFVRVKHIKEFKSDYIGSITSYYNFDFSIKKYSLQFALESGYTKIVLCDADIVKNQQKYSNESILKAFLTNTISGPVIYSYKEQQKTKSNLGNRFNYYCKQFNFNFSDDDIIMPEDCITFFDIEKEKFNAFLETWKKVSEIKYRDGLENVPAGNIDEICFAAAYNDIKLQNNSNLTHNCIYAIHDIWYR